MTNQSSRISVSIIVCVHNAPDYASVCLDSVLRHTPQPYELIIVNDGSGLETSRLLQQYAQEHEHIRIVKHKEARGYSCAANAGLRVTTSDIMILLNSDTIVPAGWLQRLVDCAQSDEAIGIVGPLSNAATYQSVPYVFDSSGRWKQNMLPEHTSVTQYANAIAEVSTQRYPRTPVANGFCFLLKRSVIDAIGYLDEDTFPRGYGEENDYCIRATDAGFDIAIADDAYVYHATSKSFGSEQREALTKDAHHAIRDKHGEERLAEIDKALRNHPEMDTVRERILQHMHHTQAMQFKREELPALQHRASNLSILFLMPECTARAGGTQAAIEIARGAARMGVKVTVATKRHSRQKYESFFSSDAHLFWYYERDTDLIEFAKTFDVAVATVCHSTRQLASIVKAHKHIKPMYFVQDYEPLFLHDNPKAKRMVESSYNMVAGCTLFAISPWVVDVIKEKHQVTVRKILGSMDETLFYPTHASRSPVPLIISCMIRPSTPWRGPERSMRVLRELKEQHGKTIEIRTFGCNLHEMSDCGLDTEFDFYHYGLLGRTEVAAMMRSSDVFLDLSDFQAFGRTALEAMACGCAVVAPLEGGIHDFGQDGMNLLQVDASSEEDCIRACNDLISDPTKRKRLSQAAIETGLGYTVHRSALSFLELIEDIAQDASTSRKAA